ncbi:hypothetical protein MYP_4716 [Sporocytophaga myxococcoides]|uniref:Uncharacterized protein n=2 Tax=Sporocytophaga myxococcoides TaxID=153721 RepID=A0A098LKG6_9BACT|nr:hypothetical protein MYP_4716 [Sporocytophaga myxococcoides]
MDRTAKYKGILGADDDLFYVLKIKTLGKGTKYYVEAYNKNNFAQKFSVNLELDGIDGAETDPAHFQVNSYAMNGKVYVFFGAYYGKEKEKMLLSISVDKNGVLSKEKEIMRTFVEDPETSFFHLSLSPDRKKVALINEIRLRKAPQHVSVLICDANTLEPLNNFTLPKEYGRGGIYSGNYVIDNSGNFYFSFNYLTSSDKVGLALGSIPFKSKGMKAIELNLSSQKEMHNGVLKINSFDNTISINGMFKDEVIKEKKPKQLVERKVGIFTYKIDMEKFAIISSFETYLSKEVYISLSYMNIVTPFLPGDKLYTADDILFTENASYFIASVSYTVKSNTTYNVSDEIIVTKINPEGKIEWMKTIPKSTSDKAISYNSVVFNDDVYFLFLEHPKNAKFDYKEYVGGTYEPIRKLDGANVVCYSLSKSGQLNKTFLYENKDFSFYPHSQNFFLDKNNGLLMHFVKGGSEKFGKVTIK